MIISFQNPLSPKNNFIFNLDFQYEANQEWVNLDVTVLEAFDALKSGLIDNRPVTKIKLFAIFDTETSIEFVYDVRAAKQGNIPWTLEQNQLTQTV